MAVLKISSILSGSPCFHLFLCDDSDILTANKKQSCLIGTVAAAAAAALML